MTLNNLPVYVISLSEAKDRRDRMTKILGDLNVDFEFIDAVDGRAYDVLNHPLYDAPKRLRSFGKHLNGGEIGCLLSHKKIYEKIVNDNTEQALIFEDDVLLRDDFLPVVEKSLSLNVQYDALRFFGSPKLERLKMRNVCKISNTHHLVRHSGMPGGAHATIMTKNGAKKILKHLNRTPYPIDALLGRNWLTNLNWYTVRPGIAAQDLSFDSSIGEDRFDRQSDLSSIQKIFYPLTRAWFKLCESLGKKYWYFKTYLKDKRYGDL